MKWWLFKNNWGFSSFQLLSFTIVILYMSPLLYDHSGLSWPWSYDTWIYNYLWSQCLSPLTVWVRIPLRQGVFDTTLCDKVCQWLVTIIANAKKMQIKSPQKSRYKMILSLFKNNSVIEVFHLLFFI